MKVIKSAKTVDEAIKLATDELSCTVEDVDVVVLEQPKSGFFGFGARNAIVEISFDEDKFELKEIDENENKEVIEKIEEVKKVEEKSVVTEKSTDDCTDFDFAKKFLSELIEKMGATSEISYKVEDEYVEFEITESDNFKILIGKGGETLDSIQYILSIFVRNNSKTSKKVYLDINNYKKRKAEQISEIAMKYAKKAIKYKKVMRLRPMNSYERRIVHSTLHNMAGVFTVSEGEDPYRKVVIKPKF